MTEEVESINCDGAHGGRLHLYATLMHPWWPSASRGTRETAGRSLVARKRIPTSWIVDGTPLNEPRSFIIGPVLTPTRSVGTP